MGRDLQRGARNAVSRLATHCNATYTRTLPQLAYYANSDSHTPVVDRKRPEYKLH